MASFTSKATGDWSTEGQTTWTEAEYPGKSSADDVTIQSGHNVTLDLATFPSSVTTINVEDGGTLTVEVNMTTAGEITGLVTIELGGILAFSAGATYQFLVNNSVAIYGTLNMDASGASSKQTIAIECGSDSQYGVTVYSGGAANLTGRTKIVATLLSGAHVATDTDITVDDDTGWEVNDEVCLATTSGINESEAVTILVDNGSQNWDCDALANNHADNGRVYNMSRSARIVANNASHASYFRAEAGAVVNCDYVEFYHLDEVKHSALKASAAQPYVGCWVWGQEANEYGFWLFDTDDIELEQCGTFAAVAGTAIRVERLAAAPLLDRCYSIGVSVGFDASLGFVHADGCEFCGNTIAAYIYAGMFYDCYFWGATLGATWASERRSSYLRGCFFGQDPGGNTVENATADIQCSVTSGWSSFEVFCDDCVFASTTEVNNPTTGMGPRGRIVSANHDQSSGMYKEWQKRGVGETITGAEARGGSGNAWRIDPSSTGWPFEFRFRFTVDNGDTVSLTFYAKGSGTLGTLSVELGDKDAGLGGVAAGSPFTVTGSYVQKTITFDNAADRNGDVEVVVKALDSSSGLLYIDDIDVAVS